MAEWPSDGGRLVRDALARLDDPSYLETCELACLIASASATAVASRGRLLRAWLDDALRTLGDGVLPLRYRDGLPVPEVCRRLGVGRSEYYRQHERGCEAVSSLLRARARPFGPAVPERATDARLPRPLTSFVGRDEEMAAVRRLLASARLLTLTGPPGAGKTRLALRVAEELRADPLLAGTVVFVGLAAIGRLELVLPTIAHALGVRDTQDRELVAAIAGAIGERRLLLVLDNFEHVVDAAPHLTDLLGRCAALRVLVTSRRRLRVSGEHCLVVPPLAEADAVELFVARARAAGSDLAVDEQDRQVVTGICRALDGLPLAIELAAARVALLPPEAILARLASRLDLLTAGLRDAPPRHRTLRGAIAWSYDLLEPPEQAFLRRLGVFVGGCTSESAAEVAGDPVALERIAVLVDGSLVRPERGAAGPRFTLHETIRADALERLATAGELDAARRSHAIHFVALAESARAGIEGPDQVASFDRLDDEHDNLRAALAWAVELGDAEVGLRLGAALHWFWLNRAYLREGAGLLERVLALPGGPLGARARALAAAGELASNLGAHDAAEALAQRGLDLASQASDEPAVAYAGWCLGAVAYRRADFSRAVRLLEESLVRGRAIGDGWIVCWALRYLGYVYEGLGDSVRMREAIREGAAVAREREDALGLAASNWRLGELMLMDGNHAGAEELLREGLLTLQRLKARRLVFLVLQTLGRLAAETGQPTRAMRLIGAATASAEQIGSSSGPLPRVDPWLAQGRRALGGPAADAALAQGRAMTLDQAVEYALVPEPPARSGGRAPRRSPSN